MISCSEMLPYYNLVSAIIKRANKDIKTNNIYKNDAEWFLNSDWGDYLQSSLSEFEKTVNDDNNLKKLNIR